MRSGRSLLLSLSVLRILSPAEAQAQTTEIIDATGDGAGAVLEVSRGIAADATGNAYVIGGFSDNAFRVSPAPQAVPALAATALIALSLVLLATGVLSLLAWVRRASEPSAPER